MSLTLLSGPPLGRSLRQLRRALLLFVLLLGSTFRSEAQTTIYALGTLTQDVLSGGLFYPPGAVAGTQGLASINPVSGLPNTQLVAISGVTGNQKLIAIDYRPLTGQLYALGYDPLLPTANARLYKLDPKSGVATPVSAAPITLLLGGASERIGFNFNPLVDLVRVVSSNDFNYRLSPITGDVVAPGTPDGPLAYATGDPNFGLNPRVGGVAYTNAYAGATSTALFDVDVKNDPSFPFGILSLQNPPNNGTLNTLADVKLPGLFGIDPNARVNLDIYWTGTFNKGYLVELTPRPNGYNATNLYRFSLPAIAGSPTDPGNTNPPGYATDKLNIVPADPSTPFDVFSIAVAPMPVITSLVPTSATVGTPGLTLTVNGTGFVNGTQVRFNGNTAAANRTTTYVSATQLTAALTIADLAVVGAYNVTVTNPPFPGVASAPAVFYVEPVCNAPTGLSAGSITSTSATISFTGNGSNSYTLTTSPATTTQTLPGTATSANLTGLTPGTSYTVTLVGNCNSGTSGGPVTMSAPATVTFSTIPFNPQIAVSQASTGIANGSTFSGFPSTQVGSTSTPITFTISNSSSTDALTLGAFTFSGPYALSGAAPTSVAPGGSATFAVTFAPTAPNTNTGSVSIANNSPGNTPYVVNFSGQGTAQDLVVSTAQAVQGSYRNVTIVGPNGVATLSGTLTVSGTLAVQTGGALVQNCQTINGAGNFDLQAGGTLAICDAAGITTSGATGAVQVGGSRTYSPLANYIYNGTVAQVTGNGLPGTVLAVGVQNAAGLALTQTLSLTQGLNLSLGNLTTNGFTFTLISNASGTAGVVNTNGVVVGTATVQRYIDPSLNGGRGYRHYSSPVANSNVNDLSTAGFTPQVNPFYNTVGASVTPFPTVFSYDETFVTTSGNPSPQDFDKGYRSPNALTDALVVTRGYTVNIPGTETVDFVGNLNNGPLTASGLTRGNQTASGYHLRGNPYPSPLDWQLMTDNNRLPGIDKALYVFKSSGQYSGSYSSYNNGVGVNGGTRFLPLGQGFFVRTSTAGTAGSIAFTNAERLTTPNNTPFQRGTADTRTQLLLSLRNGTVANQTAIYFDRNATAGFDAAADAYAFSSPNGLVLATEIPGSTEALAINGQPLLGTADVLLPLRLAAAAGTYTLAVDNLANLPAAYHAYLRDALTGIYSDLAATPSLSLTLAANSAAGGRYAVLFTTQPRVLATAPAALAQLASVYPNPAHASATLLLPVALRGKSATSVSVIDNLGRTVLTRTLAAGTIETLELPLAGLAPGVYSVLARTAAGLVAKRLVVQ